MAAQGLVAGIRQGCEFLREGKAQINEVKKAIGEVKAFAGEVKSVWGELQSLWALVAGIFGSKPKPKPVATNDTSPKPAAKTEKKKHESDLSYEEYQAQPIHDICEQLKAFFEI